MASLHTSAAARWCRHEFGAVVANGVNQHDTCTIRRAVDRATDRSDSAELGRPGWCNVSEI